MTSTPESQKTAEPDRTAPDGTEPDSTEPDSTPAETVEADGTTPMAADETTPMAADETRPVEADETTSVEANRTTPVEASGKAPVEAAEFEVEEEDEEDDEDELDDEELEAFAAPDGPGLFGAALAVVGLLATVAVLLVSFGLPALKGAPHDVPIGVTGPEAITSQIRAIFAQGDTGNFTVRTYQDEAAMRKAVTDRKIYGGLSFTESSAKMLVASGGSPVVAQSLSSVASNLGTSGGIQIPVDDVAPLPTTDPRGEGFAAIGLPIVIAGILPSLLLFVRRFRASLSTSLGVAFAFSLLSGFVLGGILQFFFKAVDGNFLVTALSISIGVAAIAFPLTGLGAVAGRIGVGIGAALMVLLGYPLSGIRTAPEWLSGFWSTIGQALPPGAEATLLRSAAFFDGHGSLTPLIVLGAWTLGGLVLCVIGALLNPLDRYEEEDEDEEELVPATA